MIDKLELIDAHTAVDTKAAKPNKYGKKKEAWEFLRSLQRKEFWKNSAGYEYVITLESTATFVQMIPSTVSYKRQMVIPWSLPNPRLKWLYTLKD